VHLVLHSYTQGHARAWGSRNARGGVATGPPRSLPTLSTTGGRCPVGPQTQDVTRFMGSNACEGARAPHQRSGWRVEVVDSGLSRGEGRSSDGKGRRGAHRRLGARCTQVARSVASLPQLWSAPGCGWRSQWGEIATTMERVPHVWQGCSRRSTADEQAEHQCCRLRGREHGTGRLGLSGFFTTGQ
jgi:hypothetical protein